MSGPLSKYDRARRGVVLLGSLQLGLTFLMCLPGLILQSTNNNYAKADATFFWIISGVCFVVGGVLTFVGVNIRPGKLWAPIVAMVVLSFQALLFGLLALGGAVEAEWPITATGALLMAASVLLIVQLSRAMLDRSLSATTHAFAPVPPTPVSPQPPAQPPPLPQPRENG